MYKYEYGWTHDLTNKITMEHRKGSDNGHKFICPSRNLGNEEEGGATGNYKKGFMQKYINNKLHLSLTKLKIIKEYVARVAW